ncbi:hypothetical protein ACFLWR_00570 [Chloroflexota bacterium]
MEKYEGTERQSRNLLQLGPTYDKNARHEAQQRLIDPELRFVDEFFWFWPLSPNFAEDGDEALMAIKQRDMKKALDIWQHHDTQSSEANISMHNLAVFNHTMALDIEYYETSGKTISKKLTDSKLSYWKLAYSRWKMLLNDERFWQRARERIRELDDPRLTTGTIHKIREELPKALLSINAKLAVEASEMNDPADMTFHISMMQQSGFDSTIVEEVIQRAVIPIRDRLKTMCIYARDETGSMPKNASKVATSLINDALKVLTNLDMLLPKGDAIREAAHDEIAQQVRSCMIAYIEETEDWRAVSTIANKSLDIAESSSLRQKIQADLDTIGQNIEYSTCWFCGGDKVDNLSAATVMMHGNVQRENKFTGTQVKWQKLPVIVPRCKLCKSAHDEQKGWKNGGIIAGIVLGILLGIALQDTWHGVLVFLVVFAGLTIGGYLISSLNFPRNMRPESYGNEFHTVKEMLSKGWEIGEKPSGVS